MEPATKQDLKDLLKEFRESMKEDIKEAVAAAFGNRKAAHSMVVSSDGDLTVDPTIVAVVPGIFSSTANDQEVLKVVHDAFPDCIEIAPVTCSTDCSHQVVVDPINIAAPTRTTCSAGGLDHLCDDRMCPSYTEQQPWPPPLRMGIRHMGHLLRPRPWPSFKYHSDLCYPEERCSESLSKIVVQEIPCNGTLNTFSGDGREVQQKTCPSENVICWIPMVPRPLPSPSQKLMQLMDNVNFTVAKRVSVISSMRSSHESHAQLQQASCARMFSVSAELQGYDRTKLRPRPWPLFAFNQETIQRKLQWTSFSGNCQAVPVVFEQYLCGQLYLKVMIMSVYEQFLNHAEFRGSGHASISFHISNARKQCSNLLGNCIGILSDQLSCLWFLKLDKNDSGFSMHDKPLHDSKQRLSELCAYSITIAHEQHLSCLATMAAHMFQSMQQLGAVSTGLPSSVCLQFVQFWPLLSFAPSSIAVQWQWDNHPSQEKNSQHIFMLPCFISKPISCEGNHGWYLRILSLFVIQAVQFAAELHYPDSSLFATVALRFGHKQRIQWTPTTAKFSVVHQQLLEVFQRAYSTPGHFSVCPIRSCCLVLLPMLDVYSVVCYELRLAVGIQLGINELLQKRISENSGSFARCPPDRVTNIAEHAKRGSELIHVVQVNYKGVQSYSCYMVQQREGIGLATNFKTMKLQIPSTEVSETCECPHFISTKAYHQMWDYFEVASSPTYPKSNEDGSVQHRVVPPYTCRWRSVQVCVQCPMLIWQMVNGVWEQANSKVYLILHWKLKDASWHRGTNIPSGTLVVYGAMPCECTPFLDRQLNISKSRPDDYNSRLPALQWTRGHFQGGRSVLPVAAVFAQSFIGHEYYLSFDCDCDDNGYILDWISIDHNSNFYLLEVYSNSDYHRDSNHIHEHRVRWDPGGCQWRRLGVKPSFKEGGVLGTLSWSPTGLVFALSMGSAQLLAQEVSYK